MIVSLSPFVLLSLAKVHKRKSKTLYTYICIQFAVRYRPYGILSGVVAIFRIPTWMFRLTTVRLRTLQF
jgi:hypothetical protein